MTSAAMNRLLKQLDLLDRALTKHDYDSARYYLGVIQGNVTEAIEISNERIPDYGLERN